MATKKGAKKEKKKAENRVIKEKVPGKISKVL